MSVPAGVAPEPPGGSGRTVWGVFGSGRVCACLVGMEFLTKALLCSRGVFLRDLRQKNPLILASVRAMGSGEEVSLDEMKLTDPGVDARRGIR